jgi:hypothetical protein
MTTEEMRLRFGQSKMTIMDRLHKLQREGKLEVKNVWRTAVNGRQCMFTVYRARE